MSAFALAAFCEAIPVQGSDVTLTPLADGTLADGGSFGPFDGIADDWDWTFNESSYEGAITLTKDPDSEHFEHRVVFEYNLTSVTVTAPVTARLTVLLRGTPRFPASDTGVQVLSYPADLLERPTDYGAEPTTVVASLSVPSNQPPTYYTLDGSRQVSEAMRSGIFRVAFRFQVNPATTELTSQAFIDALDSEPRSKPILTIQTDVPGDADRDRDVDNDDYRLFVVCFQGPDTMVPPNCRAFDFDLDTDVDLVDFDAFQYYRAFFVP